MLSLMNRLLYNNSTIAYPLFKVSNAGRFVARLDLIGKSGENPARARHCDWLKYEAATVHLHGKGSYFVNHKSGDLP